MISESLHSALKTTVLADLTEGGIHYKHVRLQYGKDHFRDTLHACPTCYSTAGLQTTDFLHFLGFSRSPCEFHRRECFCREIMAGQDVVGLAKGVTSAFEKFESGAACLENCGLPIDQPEGWGFFRGTPGSGRIFRASYTRGDGHIAAKSKRLKESEDAAFRFVFTWIESAHGMGWTTHYRAKHMPLSAEFTAALDFLGGFLWFPECPEFDFEGCWWRFTPFVSDHLSAEYAHQVFDAHAKHFSRGLERLLAAHADLEPHGVSFLKVREPAAVVCVTPSPISIKPHTEPHVLPPLPLQFDVALSFAGSERQHAEELAKRVRDAGFDVFYDDFYPEQLWGKDLPAFFDHIYRKASRFCVMFVSREYAERMWTTHERRSAQARAVQDGSHEYILPIRVDDTDLAGLPPTVYNTPENLDQGLRWIRCLNGKSIQETNDGEQA